MVVKGERFNGTTHAVGALLAVAALVVLVVQTSMRADPWRIVSCAVFGASLVVLYGASAAYHTAWGARVKQVLQKVDHAAIYVLIAGTYTPYALVTLRGGWGWTLFGINWTLAIAGIVTEMVSRRRKKKLALTLYLVMGWLVLIAMAPLSAKLPAAGLAWLFAGGVVYTLGVVFYVLDARMRHAHGIWHLFVLAGSICHFVSIARYVAA